MINSDELEKAFSDFLDGEIYDKVEEELFNLIRAAFCSGWNAAKRDSVKIMEK